MTGPFRGHLLSPSEPGGTGVLPEDRSLNLEKRSELMELVLMDAPRRLVREVLRKMDEDLDETERYEDRELRRLCGWGGVGMGEKMVWMYK